MLLLLSSGLPNPPAVSSTITVAYTPGLDQNFSNLVLELDGANGSYLAPYELSSLETGALASVRLSVPNGSYSISVLADDGNGSISATPYGPDSMEVAYFEGLKPDFSNLVIRFTDSAGNSMIIPTPWWPPSPASGRTSPSRARLTATSPYPR
jgi:hypothetical protein